MKHFAISIPILLCLAACSTINASSESDRTLTFACGETVVVGTLSNKAAYETVPIEGDLIGHGWMEANLRVRRNVHGDQLSGDVPVRYFAHTYMRKDKMFMFVLSRNDVGYKIETAQLMSGKPQPISDCR